MTSSLAQSQPQGSPSGGPFATAVSRTFGLIPPPGLLLLAIVSIQVGAAFATQLFAALGPSGVVFLRIGFAALMLLAFWRPRLDATVRANLGLLLVYGLVIALLNFSFYQAIARIPLGVAVTIEFMGPLALAVFGSRRLPEFLWIGLAVIGVLLLAPDIGPTLDPLGVAFAALGGLCWATFVLLTVRVGRVFERGSGLALGMTIAAIALLPTGLPGLSAGLAEPALLMAAFAVALLSTTIPFSLEFEALKRMPPRTYGVLITLEPAIAVMIGAALLSDSLTWRSLLAVTCVTAAAIKITLLDKGKNR